MASPEANTPIRSMPQQAPVFLSFKHGPPDEIISDKLRLELRTFNVPVLRLKDAPPIAGSLLSKEIEGRVASGVAIVTLWSDRARDSLWVRRERVVAKEANLEECLIRFPGTPLPDDWPITREGLPDKVFEPLRGAITLPGRTPSDPSGVRFDVKGFSALAKRVGLFAHTQAELRRRLLGLQSFIEQEQRTGKYAGMR